MKIKKKNQCCNRKRRNIISSENHDLSIRNKQLKCWVSTAQHDTGFHGAIWMMWIKHKHNLSHGIDFLKGIEEELQKEIQNLSKADFILEKSVLVPNSPWYCYCWSFKVFVFVFSHLSWVVETLMFLSIIFVSIEKKVKKKMGERRKPGLAHVQVSMMMTIGIQACCRKFWWALEVPE